MSYYKSSSYNGGRGGNGFRGGFRGPRGGGGGGGGNDHSWRGNRGSFNRGGHSPRGGSSTRYFNSAASFDSPRSSRTSYVGGSSPSERYSSRSRDEYHGSSSSTYSRDDYHSARGGYGRGSPEPPRKRARPDSSAYMAPRKSHERNFTSGDYPPRNFYDKSPGGFSGPEKRSYREMRDRSDDFPFRKPGAPPHSTTRGSGSFRGRSSRGSIRRGAGVFKSTPHLSRTKRFESYGVRKARTEYLRRLKQFRMKSSKRSDSNEKDGSDDDLDEIMGKMDNSEMEFWDEVGEETEEKEVDDDAKENDAKGKAQSSEKKVEKKKDSPKKPAAKLDQTEETDEAKTIENHEEEKIEREPEESKDQDPDDNVTSGALPVRLKCPHCHYSCANARSYNIHLSSTRHTSALKSLSTKLRSRLTAMRLEQRKKQRTLDDTAKVNNSRLKTFFCTVCKLNYRSLKSAHQTSVMHRKMKEFLTPFCRVCKVAFKSPWAFENHQCELLHLKKVARLVGKSKINSEEDIDFDPSSFMVLDSVGSGDENEDSNEDKSGGEAEEEKKESDEAAEGGEEKSSKEKKKPKEKVEIKLGSEHCKMVQVYYCELCRMYLPRLDDLDAALAIHCRSRTHLRRYVLHRDDKLLHRRAIQLHKEREKERQKEKELKKKMTVDSVKTAEKAVEKTAAPAENDVKTQEKIETGSEATAKVEAKVETESKDKSECTTVKKEDDVEKIWTEMDKDLSDLLQETEGAGKLADEDSLQGNERYDRFKISGKDDTTTPNGTAVTPETVKEDTGDGDKM